jgi:hypothetical protein
LGLVALAMAIGGRLTNLERFVAFAVAALALEAGYLLGSLV